jgi:hypothetical protein
MSLHVCVCSCVFVGVTVMYCAVNMTCIRKLRGKIDVLRLLMCACKTASCVCACDTYDNRTNAYMCSTTPCFSIQGQVMSLLQASSGALTTNLILIGRRYLPATLGECYLVLLINNNNNNDDNNDNSNTIVIIVIVIVVAAIVVIWHHCVPCMKGGILACIDIR